MYRRSMDARARRAFCAAVFVAFSGIAPSAQTAGVSQLRMMNGSGLIVAPSLQLSAAPSSAAAADLNGDGNPDLVVTSLGSGNVTVLLGDGKGAFTSSLSFPAGQQPGNVILADVNGDGRIDIIVTDRAAGAVQVLAGRGDGTFGSATAFPAIANPVALTAANVSGKAKIDLVVAASTGVALLLNDGTGHFRAPSNFTLTSQPVALAAADLRGQGHDDILVANQNGALSVLLGDGTGRFQPLPLSAIASGPLSSIAVGDFNRDGKLDLAVTGSIANEATILLGHGNGTFQAGPTYAVGSTPTSVLAVDLRGTGIPDLVTVNRGANTFSVLLGNGDGSFRPSLDFIAGNSPIAAVVGNFSGNGHADLLTLNSQSNSVALNAGNGDGTFVAAHSYRAGGLDRKSIASGDLNGDGRPDLVVANFCGVDPACSGPGNISVFLNDANGVYSYSGNYALGSGPVAVALADLKGDHKLALIALNRNDKSMTVVPGNGDGTFGQAQTYSLPGSPRALLAGDLNGDSKVDLAIALDCGLTVCTQPGLLSIFFGRGDGSMTESASYPTGFSPISIASGDLRGSGHSDLVVGNACGEDATCTAQGTALVFANDGTGKLTRGSEISIGIAPSAIALGSLSVSGLDLVVAQSAANKVAVLHGDGNGGFGAPVAYSVGAAPSSVALADIRGTGHLDVAVSNLQSSTLSVLFSAGNGSLQPAVTVPVGTGPEAVIATATGKGSPASLVTANGNTGASAAAVDFTVVARPQAVVNVGSFTLTTTPASPSAVNASVTLTATAAGTAGTPAGSAVFNYSTDAGVTFTPLSDCGGATGLTLNGGGAATCVTQQLPAGSLVLQAHYSGQSTVYNPTDSNQVPRTVTAAATTVSLLPNPLAPTTDEVVTLTATVVPTTTPDVVSHTVAINGTIAFNDTTTATALCAAAASTFNAATGEATLSCPVPVLTVATHSLDAVFVSGDGNYTGNTGTLSLPVTAAPTKVSVVPSSSSPTVDTSVTFNVTVAPNVAGTLSTTANQAALSGNVTVSDGGNPISTCNNLSVSSTDGTATTSCSSNTLTVGTHSITVQFTNPNSNYLASASTPPQASVDVSKADTSTTVSSTGTWTVNQTVSLTATVTPHSPVLLSNTGTVSFSDTGGTINNCSAAVTVDPATGTASCNAIVATAGAHSIRAVYNGDNNYNATTTANATPLPETAAKDNTSLGVITSGSPSNLNSSVTFTATVARTTGGATIPLSVGTAAFSDNSTMIAACATQTVTGGVATCQYAGLAAGSHTITAAYSGDPNYNTSSSFVAQSVNKSSSTVAIAAATGSPNPSTVNQSVTYTISVTPAGNPVALSGTMTVTDTLNGTTVPLAGCGSFNAATGTETCTTSTLAKGSHLLTATYSNDSSYPAATSATATQTVNPATATVALTTSTGSDTATINASVQFVATVTANPSGSAALSGNVMFADSVTGIAIPNCDAVALTSGVAKCATSSLKLGPHTITATYNNDSNFTFQAGGNTWSETITQASVSISLVNLATYSAVVNQAPPVAFTVTITAPQGTTTLSGSVVFADNGVVIPPCAAVLPAANPPNWTAVCSDSLLTAAGSPHTITAQYQKDPAFSSPTATLAQPVVVSAAATSVGVVSSSLQNTSSLNESVTFTATVTAPTAGGQGVSPYTTATFTFVDGATSQAIPNCSSLPLSASGQANCVNTGLGQGSHKITATYTDSVNNFKSSQGGVTQVVTGATKVALASNKAPSQVNDVVKFTATVSLQNALPGGVAPSWSGKMQFTANGAVIACAEGPNPAPVDATAGTAVCSTDRLTVQAAGSPNVITANYSGDTIYPNGSTTLNQTVNPIPVTLALAPTNGTSFTAINAGAPITFGVTLLDPGGNKYSGVVPLSGTVTLSLNNNVGQALTPICTAGISTSGNTASCTCGGAGSACLTLPDQMNTLVASYSKDVNAVAAAPSNASYVAVLDYQLTNSTKPPVYLTTGFTSAKDPLSPQAVSVTPASMAVVNTASQPTANPTQWYAGQVSLTCTVTLVPGGTAASATPPTCSPNTAPNISVVQPTPGAVQPSQPYLIDATSATPGAYDVTVTSIDGGGLAHQTVMPFIIRAINSTPVPIVSGATATASVQFVVPSGVTLSNLQCAELTGTGFNTPIGLSSINMSCDFADAGKPSPDGNSPQTITVPVIVKTGSTIASYAPFAPLGSGLPAVLGIPLLGLLALRKVRKSLKTTLLVVVAGAGLFVAVYGISGCGGGFTPSGGKTTSGTTPPGQYYIKVTATDANSNTYEAVLLVQVQL